MIKSNIQLFIYMCAMVLLFASCKTTQLASTQQNKEIGKTTSAKKAKNNDVQFIDEISMTPGGAAKNASATVSVPKKNTTGPTQAKKTSVPSSVTATTQTSNNHVITVVENINQEKQTPSLTELVIQPDEDLRIKYAALLNVLPAELPDMHLLKTVDLWQGTPYCFGGSTTKCIDCSGFTSTIMRDVYGVTIARSSREQYAQTPKVADDSLQAGDLLFFHTTRSGISHVGIYLANSKFIHASTSNGVMVSDLNEAYWRKSYRAAGRVEKNNNISTANN